MILRFKKHRQKKQAKVDAFNKSQAQQKTKDVQREQLAEQQQLENTLLTLPQRMILNLCWLCLMVMTKKKPIDCSIMRLRPLKHAPKKQKKQLKAKRG